MDRQEQEQLDVQIDIDESLIRDREERIRQIEVSPLQQENKHNNNFRLIQKELSSSCLVSFPPYDLVREPVYCHAL